MTRKTTSLALLLLGPVVLINLVIFIWPILKLASFSFRQSLIGGGLGGGPTLDTWLTVLRDPYYVQLIGGSVGVAAGVTVLTLLAAYPLAMFVHRASERWRSLLMALCVTPLLVSAVVRTYGWLVILGDNGLIAALLRTLGIRPPRMVFNLTGVVIALVEILMPTMILCLLAGFGRMEAALEEAAASLGASPMRVFRRVILPLTLPGILLGCLMAFVLTVSSFITPKLLGGGRVILLATEIYDQAIVTLNWPVAAVLSMMALMVFGATLLLYGRLVRAVA